MAVIHDTIQYLVERSEREEEWLEALARSPVPTTVVWGLYDVVSPLRVAAHVWHTYLADQARRQRALAPPAREPLPPARSARGVRRGRPDDRYLGRSPDAPGPLSDEPGAPILVDRSRPKLPRRQRRARQPVGGCTRRLFGVSLGSHGRFAGCAAGSGRPSRRSRWRCLDRGAVRLRLGSIRPEVGKPGLRGQAVPGPRRESRPAPRAASTSPTTQIKRFNSSGGFLTKWGSEGSGAGQFNGAGAIAADSSGHVYVADRGNGRIEKFSSSGAFLGQWGSPGSGDGQFTDIGGYRDRLIGERLRLGRLRQPDTEVRPLRQLHRQVGYRRLWRWRARGAGGHSHRRLRQSLRRGLLQQPDREVLDRGCLPRPVGKPGLRGRPVSKSAGHRHRPGGQRVRGRLHRRHDPEVRLLGQVPRQMGKPWARGTGSSMAQSASPSTPRAISMSSRRATTASRSSGSALPRPRRRSPPARQG